MGERGVTMPADLSCCEERELKLDGGTDAKAWLTTERGWVEGSLGLTKEQSMRRRMVELNASSYKPGHHKLYQLNPATKRGIRPATMQTCVEEEKQRMMIDLDKHVELTARFQKIAHAPKDSQRWPTSGSSCSALEKERSGTHTPVVDTKQLLDRYNQMQAQSKYNHANHGWSGDSCARGNKFDAMVATMGAERDAHSRHTTKCSRSATANGLQDSDSKQGRMTYQPYNIGTGTVNNSVQNCHMYKAHPYKSDLASAYPSLDTHSRLHDTMMSHGDDGPLSQNREISSNRGHRGWHRPGHVQPEPPSDTNSFDARFRDANRYNVAYSNIIDGPPKPIFNVGK